MFCTGWYKYWGDPPRQLGGDPSDVSTFHFPALSTSAAQWLVDEREIYGVATEGPSIEPPANVKAGSVSTHQALFKGKIWAVESLNNACQLPPRGSIVGAYPMKIEEGSGGPVRVVAVVSDTSGGNMHTTTFGLHSVIILTSVAYIIYF